MSNVADHLAANHGLACDNSKARHVPVDGLDPVAMVDDHLAAVATRHLSHSYQAVARSADRHSSGRGDVDASVELAFAVTQNRVLALTKAAGDGAHDGPQRRNKRRGVRTAETSSED